MAALAWEELIGQKWRQATGVGNSGRTQEECARAPPEPLSAQKVREVLAEESRAEEGVVQPFIICIQVLLLSLLQ